MIASFSPGSTPSLLTGPVPRPTPSPIEEGTMLPLYNLTESQHHRHQLLAEAAQERLASQSRRHQAALRQYRVAPASGLRIALGRVLVAAGQALGGDTEPATHSTAGPCA